MATISVCLAQKTKRNGKNAIVISLAHNQRTLYIPTGYECSKQEYDSIKQQVKDDNLNLQLQQQVIALKTKLHTLNNIEHYDCKTLKELLTKEEKPQITLMSELFDKYLAEKNLTVRTMAIYEATKRKLQKYDKNFKTLLISDIDNAYLLGFEKYCIEKGNQTNSIGIHLRNIRSLINLAIDDEIINKYPFRKFKIKKAETEKRALEVEQLQAFFNSNCPVYHKDYCKLFLYLIGINFVDLFNLKNSDIKNGRIEYIRAKTGKKYSIKIEPEIKRLIDQYRSQSDYLLNISDRSPKKDYRGVYSRFSNIIKRYGMTTYKLRHTWATMAYRQGIAKDTISDCLGHSIDHNVTDIYIKRNTDNVDVANRQMIDFFQKIIPNY